MSGCHQLNNIDIIHIRSIQFKAGFTILDCQKEAIKLKNKGTKEMTFSAQQPVMVHIDTRTCCDPDLVTVSLKCSKS